MIISRSIPYTPHSYESSPEESLSSNLVELQELELLTSEQREDLQEIIDQSAFGKSRFFDILSCFIHRITLILDNLDEESPKTLNKAARIYLQILTVAISKDFNPGRIEHCLYTPGAISDLIDFLDSSIQLDVDVHKQTIQYCRLWSEVRENVFITFGLGIILPFVANHPDLPYEMQLEAFSILLRGTKSGGDVPARNLDFSKPQALGYFMTLEHINDELREKAAREMAMRAKLNTAYISHMPIHMENVSASLNILMFEKIKERYPKGPYGFIVKESCVEALSYVIRYQQQKPLDDFQEEVITYLLQILNNSEENPKVKEKVAEGLFNGITYADRRSPMYLRLASDYRRFLESLPETQYRWPSLECI